MYCDQHVDIQYIPPEQFLAALELKYILFRQYLPQTEYQTPICTVIQSQEILRRQCVLISNLVAKHAHELFPLRI